jgi:hypothetical protein
MAGPSRHRTVIEDDSFRRSARRIEADARRLDELIDAAKWGIARGAEAWPSIPGTRLRVVTTEPFPGAPALAIFFSIEDDNQARLRDVIIVESADLDLGDRQD